LKLIKADKILIIALLLGLVFSLYGIHWGLVNSWNPDQMAFKSLFQKGNLPLNPGWFHKPPFHTYFNFFLSVAPFIVINKILNLSPHFLYPARLIWSRILTVFLFLGSITLVFYITKRFFTLFAARIITIIFSTSAGFIAFSHFLTSDIPVLFWMLLAFYFTQNIFFVGRSSDYVLAGFFTGIATATKYNGLAVGVAIVVAHVLSFSSFSWRKLFLNKKLFWGLFMVVIGFIIGNPFAVLDYSTFISDFVYNYTVTPVYSGVTYDHGYWKFLSSFIEIIGFPSTFLLVIAFLFSLYFLFAAKENSVEKKAVLLLLSVFLIYYYKIGSFSHLPIRFVMPIVPLCLIISGPFWNKIRTNRIVLSGLLVIIISYNLICSFYVGKRFVEDPRMKAIEWVKENIQESSSLEYTKYNPAWNSIAGVNLKATMMPYISGRRRSFERMFKNNPWVMEKLQKVEKRDEREHWYSLEQLMTRRPDYIAVDSLLYNRFMSKILGKLYPSIKIFFTDLLNEKYPYKIVFDQESKETAFWIYPQQIDFLYNRITILSRNDLLISEK